MFYKAVLVSAVQQPESAISIYIYSLLSLLPTLTPIAPSRLSPAKLSTKLSPVLYTASLAGDLAHGSICVSATSQFVPPSPYPTPCPQACSLSSLRLSSCNDSCNLSLPSAVMMPRFRPCYSFPGLAVVTHLDSQPLTSHMSPFNLPCFCYQKWQTHTHSSEYENLLRNLFTAE